MIRTCWNFMLSLFRHHEISGKVVGPMFKDGPCMTELTCQQCGSKFTYRTFKYAEFMLIYRMRGCPGKPSANARRIPA